MICKKCDNYFPTKIKIDGKTRNLSKRRYCLDCSPFGTHNTKKIHKPPNKKIQCECSICNREYIYDSTRGHSKTKCNTCRNKETRRKLKKRAIDYKGGKCVLCSYNRCIDGLCFHHIDPDKKDFNICGGPIKWQTLKKELDKCVLLCALCHIEVHCGIKEL